MNQGGHIVQEPTKKPTYRERIGDREWDMPVTSLDVHEDVVLWDGNPRLVPYLPANEISSPAELEAYLQKSPGYDTLRRSIDEIGQMEPIYARPIEGSHKHLVLEGATRVTILRQLDRKYTSGMKEGRFRQVKAKILPPDFGRKEQTILLARVHVRGSGVRGWDRYVQAQYIHKAVVGSIGQPPLMNVSEMATYMEKSVSWVQRLRDAYEFSRHFVDHVDSNDAEQLATSYFSVLEEASKAKTIGSQLRDYENPKFDKLRADVFDMVEGEAFNEYRDARFLKDFYDDPEKWDQLKSGEKNVASRLAIEIKSNSSSPKARIANIPKVVERSIKRGNSEFDEDDVAALQQAIDQISDQMHDGVPPFRVALKKITKTLSHASMAEVRTLESGELEEFNEALNYFQELVEKHARAA